MRRLTVPERQPPPPVRKDRLLNQVWGEQTTIQTKRKSNSLFTIRNETIKVPAENLGESVYNLGEGETSLIIMTQKRSKKVQRLIHLII